MGQYTTKTFAFAYGSVNGQRKKLYKERKKLLPLRKESCTLSVYLYVTHPKMGTANFLH